MTWSSVTRSALVVCVASSVSTDASASAWLENPGTARLALSYQRLATERQFAPGDAPGFTGPLCPDPVLPGDRMPYSCVTGGRFTAHSLTLSSSIGVARWLTADLQVPAIFEAAFEDDLGRTERRGLGDVRFGARAGTQWDRVAASAAVEAKAPTGPTGFVDRDVPIGEGQWDLSAGARVGVSLHPWGWVESHQSFVLRLTAPENGVNPGDEWRGTLGGGVTPIEWAGVLATAEWMLAIPDTSAFGLPQPGRRLLQLRTALFVRSGDALWLELGVATPLMGRRWPAAPALYASVATRLGG